MFLRSSLSVALLFVVFGWTSVSQNQAASESDVHLKRHGQKSVETELEPVDGNGKQQQVMFNPAEGQIVINADVRGQAEDGHGLIKMNVKKGDCGANMYKKDGQPWMVMRIEQYGDCMEGVIFCYVGRLDPNNERLLGRGINTQFYLPNQKGNELAKRCAEAKSEFWSSWDDSRHILHGFTLTTAHDGTKKEVQLATSTHRNPVKYRADVPFTLNLGEPGKLGGYVDKQEDHKFPERMRMGMLLRDEKADFCLAYDLLAGVGGDTELIGLIIPNEKQCQMTITLEGSVLQYYPSKNSSAERKEKDKKKEKAASKGTMMFDDSFEPNNPDNRIWIMDEGDLPKRLDKDIFRENMVAKDVEDVLKQREDDDEQLEKTM